MGRKKGGKNQTRVIVVNTEKELEKELSAAADSAGDDDDNAGENIQPWGEKFEEWRAGLGDDIEAIRIYVYRQQKAPGAQIKLIQEFLYTIPRDGEYPDTHQIGLQVGAGDFQVIARAGGNLIMQKVVHLGPAYNDLRDEYTAQLKTARAAAPVLAGAPAPAPFDPVSSFERIAAAIAPFAGILKGMFNPSENIRRMNDIGEQMATRSFNFGMDTAKRARDKILEVTASEEEDDPPSPRAAASGSGAHWEEKLGDLADLLLWKGKKFLEAPPREAARMRETVQRKVLDDEGFQALLQNPKEFGKAYAKLCHDCAEIGGAKTVGDIFLKMGIKLPPMVNRQNGSPAAHAKPGRAASRGAA